jgi:hypothetical protein
MKKHYAAPSMELFPMETEGAVMSQSGTGTVSDMPGYSMDATAPSALYGTGGNYSASGSDLEEMINDILTY